MKTVFKIKSFVGLFLVLAIASPSQGLLCKDLLNNNSLYSSKAETRLNFGKNDLLAFEMVAAAIVFRMTNKKLRWGRAIDLPKHGEIILTTQDLAKIQNELSNAFDSIFSSENENDSRMVYPRTANRRSNTFDLERLSRLYIENPDFTHDFLSKNIDAITENARKMQKMQFGFRLNLWRMQFSLSPNALRDRLWNTNFMPSNGFKLFSAGAIVLVSVHPHRDILATWRYLVESYGLDLIPMTYMSLENAAPLAGALAGLYLVTKPIQSLWLTSSAPSYEEENYNSEIGAGVREDFFKRAIEAHQPELDFESSQQ